MRVYLRRTPMVLYSFQPTSLYFWLWHTKLFFSVFEAFRRAPWFMAVFCSDQRSSESIFLYNWGSENPRGAHNTLWMQSFHAPSICVWSVSWRNFQGIKWKRKLLGIVLLMVSVLQDDAIYSCANPRCLKPEFLKENVKGLWISTLTQVLVCNYKCFSDIFMKRVPGLQKCSSVLLNWQAFRLCILLYKLQFIFSEESETFPQQTYFFIAKSYFSISKATW